MDSVRHTFVVGNEAAEFQAHPAVIKELSIPFRHLIQTSTEAYTVMLPELSKNNFASLLEFAYEGKYKLPGPTRHIRVGRNFLFTGHTPNLLPGEPGSTFCNKCHASEPDRKAVDNGPRSMSEVFWRHRIRELDEQLKPPPQLTPEERMCAFMARMALERGPKPQNPCISELRAEFQWGPGSVHYTFARKVAIEAFYRLIAKIPNANSTLNQSAFCMSARPCDFRAAMLHHIQMYRLAQKYEIDDLEAFAMAMVHLELQLLRPVPEQVGDFLSIYCLVGSTFPEEDLLRFTVCCWAKCFTGELNSVEGIQAWVSQEERRFKGNNSNDDGSGNRETDGESPDENGDGDDQPELSEDDGLDAFENVLVMPEDWSNAADWDIEEWDSDASGDQDWEAADDDTDADSTVSDNIEQNVWDWDIIHEGAEETWDSPGSDATEQGRCATF